MTKEIKAQLLKNGIAQEKAGQEDRFIDFKPVVKFFIPVGSQTWIISESDPHNEDILFGLCDLGMGFPELGTVALSELENLKLPFGLGIERDQHWEAQKTLSAYSEEASKVGHIQA